jgi:hypothetical protein
MGVVKAPLCNHAVFTALKDVLKASHKPTLPKMRLGRYEKASWGIAYFLRDVFSNFS